MCLFVVFCFSKNSCRPAQDESELVQGFLLHVFTSLIKKVVLIPTLFIFCAFYGKMVIKKPKNLFQMSTYNHSLAKIKHAD